jgi:hypothetical protein
MNYSFLPIGGSEYFDYYIPLRLLEFLDDNFLSSTVIN